MYCETNYKVTSLGGEDPEAVVPEAAGDEEAGVHSGHKAVPPGLQALAEVVAEVASLQRVGSPLGWENNIYYTVGIIEKCSVLK